MGRIVAQQLVVIRHVGQCDRQRVKALERLTQLCRRAATAAARCSPRAEDGGTVPCLGAKNSGRYLASYSLVHTDQATLQNVCWRT